MRTMSTGQLRCLIKSLLFVSSPSRQHLSKKTLKAGNTQKVADRATAGGSLLQPVTDPITCSAWFATFLPTNKLDTYPEVKAREAEI